MNTRDEVARTASKLGPDLWGCSTHAARVLIDRGRPFTLPEAQELRQRSLDLCAKSYAFHLPELAKEIECKRKEAQ